MRPYRPLAAAGAVVFSLAFGYVEAVVVVYIRLAVSGTMDPRAAIEAEQLATAAFPWWIELTREVATILMLAGVAVALGRGWWERAGFFLLAFALWDAQYYVALKILTGWPPSLDATDVYFLIPVPWVGPVWLPLLLDAFAVGLTRPLWWPRRAARS